MATQVVVIQRRRPALTSRLDRLERATVAIAAALEQPHRLSRATIDSLAAICHELAEQDRAAHRPRIV